MSVALLEDSFAIYRIGWQFFSLSTLNMSSSAFWHLCFLMKNELLILPQIPYMWWVASFKISVFSEIVFDNVWISFRLSCLEFIELLECVNSGLSSNLESIWSQVIQRVSGMARTRLKSVALLGQCCFLVHCGPCTAFHVDQKVQTSSYKNSRSRGCNVQHEDYS